MRVLFTTPGGWGHIHPTVPLARAMVERGHELVWAVPARSAEQVERAGFDAAATSDAPPVGPRELVAAYPELLEHPPEERPDHMFSKLFGALPPLPC